MIDLLEVGVYKIHAGMLLLYDPIVFSDDDVDDLPEVTSRHKRESLERPKPMQIRSVTGSRRTKMIIGAIALKEPARNA